jgi:hypothetical protein
MPATRNLRVVLTVAILSQIAIPFLGCSSARSTSCETQRLLTLEQAFDKLLPTSSTWKGTLTYLDYTSNKPTTIPSTFKLTQAADSSSAWNFAIGYDEEPHANSATRLELRDYGRVLQLGDTTETVLSSIRQGNRVDITTQFTAADDNKPATIRKVYIISPNAFSMQKLVKFADQPDFFERHIYQWSR